MIKPFFAAVISILGATSAGAASFDCDKAATSNEKAICADRGLNDADVRMTTMFEMEADLVAMGERDALRAAQKKWLEGRDACDGNVDCLRTAYDRRLEELQKMFKDVVSRGP